MKFLRVSFFEKTAARESSCNQRFMETFAKVASLHKATNVSSALTQRFLRDLSVNFSIIFLNTKVG